MTAQETNVVNAVSTTLANTMNAGATSFVVSSATGFPSAPFYVVIDPDTPANREYMLVTSRSGTTCTLSSSAMRNLSGSAGDVEHLAGVPVRVSPPMKQMFDDLHDRIDATLEKAGGTMTGALTLSGAPTVDLHAATKKYVDDAITGVAAGSVPANDAAEVLTAETTSSTSYGALATPGPSVTVTTGTKAWVTVSSKISNSTINCGGAMGFAVSDSTTLAAGEGRNLVYISPVAGQSFTGSFTMLLEGLTAGSNTFTAQYAAEVGGTATFTGRRISVQNAGS